MNTHFDFDFLGQNFECSLKFEKVNRHQTKIYKLRIITHPISIAAFGRVHQLKNNLFEIAFDSPYYFGMFGGSIAEKISEELQKLEL